MDIDPAKLKRFFKVIRKSWVDYENTADAEETLAQFRKKFAVWWPNAAQGDCDKILNVFLDYFFVESVLKFSHADRIISRHMLVMELLGRDPMELEFYREQARVFALTKLRNAWFRAQFGPQFACIASDGPDGWEQMSSKDRQAFRQELLSANPETRAAFLADKARLANQLSLSKYREWSRTGLQSLPWTLPMSAEEQLAQFNLPFNPTADEACHILEYHCMYGSKYASNFPTLDKGIARNLAQSLPRGRADLERLVKYTNFNTEDSVKRMLLDALRGTKRSWLDRVLRRQASLDAPELWQEWIDSKRMDLLAQIALRKPLGRAATEPNASDWVQLGGQAYDLDVVGYAKRIARAQSAGADVRTGLKDLRALISIMHSNLEVLQAELPEAAENSAWDEVMPLPNEKDKISDCPSLFGLLAPPTDLQLALCEARSLDILRKLEIRIALLQEYPGLIVPDNDSELWLRTDDTYCRYYYDFYQTGTAMVLHYDRPAPEGLLQRLDGLSFDMLDGPYIVDTEPSFTEVEYKSWRWSIWMVGYLPAETALPQLQALADVMFGGFMAPRKLHGRIGRGYRQAELAGALLSAVELLPDHAIDDFYNNLIGRVQDEDLKKELGEQKNKRNRYIGRHQTEGQR